MPRSVSAGGDKLYGITHEKTLQLNGLAKMMNKTLIERVRYMFFEAKLAKHIWGEELSTIMHAINLSFVVAFNSEMPNKIWFGKNVKYDYLRVFDCKAFVHVPKDERSKLGTKSREYIFVGYHEDEFGYIFYGLIEKKLVRNHDVKFMENKTIEDTLVENQSFTSPFSRRS
uniref:Retrovirus-related Pol polyprotein from transposon TNT 1-94 n=1 Tax=Cajanus cajan TaxID=3821 RepID=A0A151SY86_CAJCA|nr:Retrovirus-related Pol polyprotein from transposon TNT 1-94 [Cajanus cajan]